MTAAGRDKLRAYRHRAARERAPVRRFHCASSAGPRTVACPRCGATDTERLSEFGSTACKALYRCLECREPFDYFKPI